MSRAPASTARAAKVRRERYCSTNAPAAARSHDASRTRDGTHAKPVSAVGRVAPTRLGTIRNAITTASTPRAARNVSVIVAVTAANASTGRLIVRSTHTAGDRGPGGLAHGEPVQQPLKKVRHEPRTLHERHDEEQLREEEIPAGDGTEEPILTSP